MILYGKARSSKLLDQGISNFLFQILLDSTLELEDLVYYFSCVGQFVIGSLKIYFTEQGLISLRAWKI